MLQTLDFVGARLINFKATFFRYERGSAGGLDEAIRVRAGGQDLGVYYPGDAIELIEPETAWEVTPINSNTAGVVRLGVGRVQSARLVGNVKVIDQSADQTAALNQYVAMNGVSDNAKGVVAGLWAQTKPITIRAIQFGSSAAGGMAVLYGNGRPLTNQGAAPAPANKMIGSPAASSALPVSGTVAGAFPVTTADLAGAQTVGYTSVQAGTLYRIDLKTPIVIPVGKFFGFATNVANASVNFIAEIEE